MNTLDTLLADADPGHISDDGVDELLLAMSEAADEPAPAERPTLPRWKRRRVLIPAAIGVALATAAAAIVVPLSLRVGDHLTEVDLDVQIPIAYTTASGVNVSCDYGMYVGDPASRSAADQELADFLHAQDWTGIGQEIYEEAIANPFVPGPDDNLEVDTQEIRDRFSFERAVNAVIHDRIPSALLAEGTQIGATMNCSGRLR